MCRCIYSPSIFVIEPKKPGLGADAKAAGPRSCVTRASWSSGGSSRERSVNDSRVRLSREERERGKREGMKEMRREG